MTPQQNSVAERMNISIVERARCLRLNAGLAKTFWVDAVSMACYLINKSPRASLGGKLAEEAWTGIEVDYFGLRVFGCPASVHVASEEISNLTRSLDNVSFLDMRKG